MPTLTCEEKLADVCQLLEDFVLDKREVYHRYASSGLTDQDKTELAVGCLTFWEKATGCLIKLSEMEHPLSTSTFCWSCFNSDIDFLREFIDKHNGKNEYATEEEADEKIRVEDGEQAFDTGQIMRKMLFGIYGYPVNGKWKLQADDWDLTNRHLLGCATVLDWEWYRDFGIDEDVTETFDKEIILQRLQEEVEDLEYWLNNHRNHGNN